MNFKLNSTTIYVSVLVVIVFVFGVVYTVIKQPDSGLEVVAAETETKSESYEEKAAPQKITVHIVGEVVNADIYTLDEGSRVKDIINMAGGVTPDADTESVNLAAFLQDAEQITIPKKYYAAENETENVEEEVMDKTSTSASETKISSSVTNKSSKININTADMTELMTLDGIGEALSRSIIVYRETNGRFGSIEDIKKIDRIGTKTFNKIKDHICVN